MSFLNWLLRRRQIDRDLDAEIRNHFEMAIAERIAGGEDPESARLAAINEFGNVLQAKEEARQVWRGNVAAVLTDFWQDVRFGTRMLIKNPGFSLVVIAVLSLGIAGNAAIFSLFKGMALRPLPGVARSGELAVTIGRTTDGRQIAISLPDYRYIKEHDQAFVDLAASEMIFASVGLGPEAERIIAELVSGNYFQALGVTAQLGRTLQPSDDLAPRQHPVAVLSDTIWRKKYQADPAIIGKTVYLNGQPLTVVGVAARGFQGTVVSLGVDVFAPVMMQPVVSPPDRLDARGVFNFMTIGHLRPGVTLSAAAAQAGVLAAQLDHDAPIQNFTRRTTVIPIWKSPFGAQTYWLPTLVVLGVMGLLILLVVCANVANLVLVRGVSRNGELAVRLALGASRARLLRLLFVENLVLAIPGALAGVAMSGALLPLIESTAGGAAPARVYLDTAVDSYVVGFALALSCGCALVFGFVPALRTSRVELTALMNDISPRLASRGRLRAALVVSQVAVSLLLLIAAGLMLRSYTAARSADGGFDAHGVTAVAVDLQTPGYDDKRGTIAVTKLLDALGSDPAFSSATMALNVPLGLVDSNSRAVTIEGYTPRSDEDMIFLYNVVSPDYFRTLKVPLLAGREFARTDDQDHTPVVVINEMLARRMWQTPDNAIGKRLRSGGAWHTIVGVAATLKYSRLSEAPRPFVYFSLLQSYAPALTVHARTAGDLAHALRRVREHVNQIDPKIPIVRSTTLADQTRIALSMYGLGAGALLIFGAITIVLSAIGIYGLVAYTVQQSTHEIGIRMAVGAQRADVAWTFLSRGAGLAATGAVIGLIVAAAVSGVIGSFLYGVSARDLVAFAGGTAIVMTIALVASFVPAWKASRVDPLTALRHR
jgi:predicted permease